MIILASTSPTRQGMLSNSGLQFNAVAPCVDERDLMNRHQHWSPSETALKLAEAKAVEVSAKFPDAVVIGADQVLASGTTIYSKPSGRDQCRQHLRELRGRMHSLISGVACARNGMVEWSHIAEARLTMRMFSDDFLETYLDAVGTDCTTSVGGYKIEGLGVQLFEKVKGDHFTILGLPLIPLLEHLRAAGEILT